MEDKENEVQVVPEGYEKLETDLVLARIDAIGQQISGVYTGVELLKTPDGKAEYLGIEVDGVGVVAIPINPSLSRAVNKLDIGDSVIIELIELVPQKGGKQDFKKYAVYRKRKVSSFNGDEDR